MFLLDPMPRMRLQIGKLGIMGLIDLNCGWYCEKAVLDYWFRKLIHEDHPSRIRLPKGTAFGYDPEDDAAPNIQGLITRSTKVAIGPTALAWETSLPNTGPVIVSGKLGGANWGTVRGHKLGVGHWVVIVGADNTVVPNRIYYKDPLQGDGVKHSDFNQFYGRMDSPVYYLTSDDALSMMARLGTGT